VGRSASIRPQDDSVENDKLYQLVYELYEQFKDDAGSAVWESESLKKKLAKAMGRVLSVEAGSSTSLAK
jgi:hypothetical protein